MSRTIRRLIYLALGLLAGVAAWPVLEWLLTLQSRFTTYLAFSVTSGVLFGSLYGLFLGCADGIIAGTWRRIGTGALFGLLVAAVGGAVGFVLGQGLLLLVGELFLGRDGFVTVGRPIARAIGWAVLGVGVGAAEGVRSRSLLKTGIGALGGVLGGLAGGLVLEYAPLFLPEPIARPVGLLVFGASVALLQGLVEHRLAGGLLRVLNGTWKGKEFILNQRRVTIGAAPGADVPLPGYRGVEPRHATIQTRAGELHLVPDSAAPVRLNDQPVPAEGSKPLKYEDVLQVGSAKLFYKPLALLFALLAALAVGAPRLDAQTLRIAQVDPSRLLARQRVDLYLSASDPSGESLEGLTPESFRVYESTDGSSFEPVPIVGFDASPNVRDGVTFFLLVDNSGSMYDRLDGSPAETAEQTRMWAAREAIRRFVASISNPRDRVALAEFNTYYRLIVPPTDSVRLIDAALDEIERPDRRGSYTELYRATALAAEDLRSVSGRKVLIILSDGENYPFARWSGEPHPRWGDELLAVDATVLALQRVGAGAFGINFATAGDPSMEEIVRENGGLLFDAASGEDLGAVYGRIRERVLTEYRVTYRAGIAPAERRYVRVELVPPGGGRVPYATRVYFSGTIFGLPRDDLGALMLVPLFVALLGALVLTFLRLRNKRSTATVEVLDARGLTTQVFAVTEAQTVIGASSDANVTIAGAPDVHDRHATIVFDEKDGSYTVVSDHPIRVNNQPTERRRLEPGDVVQLPGATVVFDRPDEPSD